VRVEPTGDAVIAGRAAPNARIELRDDGRVVAQTSADALGEFTMLPPPFSAGEHRLELAARTGEAAPVLSESVAIDVQAPTVKASNSTAPADDHLAIPSITVVISFCNGLFALRLDELGARATMR
jgi:hypothetical protein